MLHTPFTPFRNAFIRDLKTITDEELLELLYCCLRCVNYFQDEDDRFVYLKIFEDIQVEVKRRQLKFTWTNKDVKKFRIIGQKLYYGSLPVKELEWRLACIIMYTIPVCRKFVKSKRYLVRERIHIIIEAIRQQHCWSELEYNKDLLGILNVPFFSFDNFSDIFHAIKKFLLLSENIIIFFLFVLYKIIKVICFIWPYFDRDYIWLTRILIVTDIMVESYLLYWYFFL